MTPFEQGFGQMVGQGLGGVATVGAGAARVMGGLGMLNPAVVPVVQEKLFGLRDAIERAATDLFAPRQPETFGQRVARGAGQAVGVLGSAAVGGAAAPVATSLLGSANEAAGDVQAGVPLDVAQQRLGVNAAANAVGLGLPAALPGRVLTRVATGAGLNVASDETARVTTNALLPEANADRVQEFDPANAVVSAALGGATGGVVGPRAPALSSRGRGDGGLRGLNVGAAETDAAQQRRATAQQLDVPIDLTSGQATRDLVQQRAERETAKTDTQAGRELRDRYDEQRERWWANLDATRTQTGAEAADATQAGQSIRSELQRQYAADKAVADEAYQRAREQGDTAEVVDTAPLVDYLQQNRDAAENAPVLGAVRRSLERLGGTRDGEAFELDVNGMEELRKTISNTADMRGPDAHFAGEMKRLIDASLDDAGGDSYRNARRLWREMRERYNNRSVINDLLGVKRGTADLKVADERAFNRLVLASSGEDVRHLVDTLRRGGSTGEQAMRELRAQLVAHVQDQAGAGVQRDSRGTLTPQLGALNRTLRVLDTGGKLDLLMGKAGAQRLRDIGEIAQVLESNVAGAVNTSNSGTLLAGMFDAVVNASLSGIPVPLGIGTVFKNWRKSRNEKTLLQDARRAMGELTPRPAVDTQARPFDSALQAGEATADTAPPAQARRAIPAGETTERPDINVRRRPAPVPPPEPIPAGQARDLAADELMPAPTERADMLRAELRGESDADVRAVLERRLSEVEREVQTEQARLGELSRADRLEAASRRVAEPSAREALVAEAARIRRAAEIPTAQAADTTPEAFETARTNTAEAEALTQQAITRAKLPVGEATEIEVTQPAPTPQAGVQAARATRPAVSDAAPAGRSERLPAGEATELDVQRVEPQAPPAAGETLYSRGGARATDSEDRSAAILQGDPVVRLTGDEAPRQGFGRLREWATKLFDDSGNLAVNPRIGEVEMTERSVRDSMAHGMSRRKANAFAAAKDVIEKGAVVLRSQDGRVESIFISAPVAIGGEIDIVTTLVHRDVNTQRMYLHSVATKESLLTPQSGAGTEVPGGPAKAGVGGFRLPTGTKASSADVRRVLENLLTRDLRGEGPADSAAASAAAPPGTFASPQALEQSLRATFGGKLIDGLLRRGVLHLGDAAPEDVPRDARGRFTGTRAELFFDRLDAASAPAVLMHEVGEHFGIKRMLGDARYLELLTDLRALRQRKDVSEAWEAVRRDYVDERGRPQFEEGGETFMREVAARLVESAPDRPVVKRILEAVRAWVYREWGVNLGRVDPALLQALAAAALRKSSEGKL